MTRDKEPPDQPPSRLFGGIRVALARVCRRLLARRRAAPDPRSLRPLEAIPFPDLAIPDEVLARMVETLDTEPACDLETLSARFGYPVSLIERELPLYRARYERWISSHLGG